MERPPIEVTGRRAPVRCAVCHGALSGAVETCGGCGAAFHDDCRPARGCVTPACAAPHGGRAATEPPRPAPATTRAPVGTSSSLGSLLVLAAMLLVPCLGGAAASALRSTEREAERARRDAEAARRQHAERVRRERRKEALPAVLAELRVALREADQRAEPFRALALDQVRVRALGVAFEPGAAEEPSVRQFFGELEAALARKGRKATASDYEVEMQRLRQDLEQRERARQERRE